MIHHIRSTLLVGLRRPVSLLHMACLPLLLAHHGSDLLALGAAEDMTLLDLLLIPVFGTAIAVSGFGGSTTAGKRSIEAAHPSLPLSRRTRALAETVAITLVLAAITLGGAAIVSSLFGRPGDSAAFATGIVLHSAPLILSVRLRAEPLEILGVLVVEVESLVWFGAVYGISQLLGGGVLGSVAAALVVFVVILVRGRPLLLRTARIALPNMDNGRVRRGLAGPVALRAHFWRGQRNAGLYMVGAVVAWPVFLGGIHWLMHAEIEAPGLSLLGGLYIGCSVAAFRPLGLALRTSRAGRAFGLLPVARHQFARTVFAHALGWALVGLMGAVLSCILAWQLDLASLKMGSATALLLGLTMTPLLCGGIIAAYVGTQRERSMIFATMMLAVTIAQPFFILAYRPSNAVFGSPDQFAALGAGAFGAIVVGTLVGMGPVVKYLRAPA